MSAEIHYITERQPHQAGPARCIACKHEWVAVAPVGLDVFECPACGCHKGTYAGIAARNDVPLWQCKCGCTVFTLTPMDAYCCSCSAWQDWKPESPLKPTA